MNYYVSRNGQTYGPYNEEIMRKYLAEGSMMATDMARTEAMPNWIPLGQLLSVPAAADPAGRPLLIPLLPIPLPPTHTPPAYAAPGYSAPGYSAQQPMAGGGAPAPPSLHWGCASLIAIFFGVFITIWAFIQANWSNPSTRRARPYAISSSNSACPSLES